MKKLCCTTSINGDTSFSISIAEDLGWIEPVFLLISPNLKEVLRLPDEPPFLLQIEHFEIIWLGDCYGVHFFDSKNGIIKGNTSELKVVKAQYVGKEVINNNQHSMFNSSYCFNEISNYQEFCFFFICNKNTQYLTLSTAFAVDNYV